MDFSKRRADGDGGIGHGEIVKMLSVMVSPGIPLAVPCVTVPIAMPVSTATAYVAFPTQLWELIGSEKVESLDYTVRLQ